MLKEGFVSATMLWISIIHRILGVQTITKRVKNKRVVIEPDIFLGYLQQCVCNHGLFKLVMSQTNITEHILYL